MTGVIQAGGKSTRMGGRPKALLELGGRRIVERVVAAVAPAVDGLLVVTNTPELYAFLGLPMVGDVYPDHGSLGGIYSGLRAAPGDAAFTVACDMPFLHPDVVRLVVARAGEGDVVIPRVGGQWPGGSRSWSSSRGSAWSRSRRPRSGATATRRSCS